MSLFLSILSSKPSYLVYYLPCNLFYVCQLSARAVRTDGIEHRFRGEPIIRTKNLKVFCILIRCLQSLRLHSFRFTPSVNKEDTNAILRLEKLIVSLSIFVDFESILRNLWERRLRISGGSKLYEIHPALLTSCSFTLNNTILSVRFERLRFTSLEMIRIMDLSRIVFDDRSTATWCLLNNSSLEQSCLSWKATMLLFYETAPSLNPIHQTNGPPMWFSRVVRSISSSQAKDCNMAKSSKWFSNLTWPKYPRSATTTSHESLLIISKRHATTCHGQTDRQTPFKRLGRYPFCHRSKKKQLKGSSRNDYTSATGMVLAFDFRPPVRNARSFLKRPILCL